MALEIGDGRRFSGPDHRVSYTAVVPMARESAEWKPKDKCPRDGNVYLKGAYVEAANLISAHRKPEEVYRELRTRRHVLSSTHG